MCFWRRRRSHEWTELHDYFNFLKFFFANINFSEAKYIFLIQNLKALYMYYLKLLSVTGWQAAFMSW